MHFCFKSLWWGSSSCCPRLLVPHICMELEARTVVHNPPKITIFAKYFPLFSCKDPTVFSGQRWHTNCYVFHNRAHYWPSLFVFNLLMFSLPPNLMVSLPPRWLYRRGVVSSQFSYFSFFQTMPMPNIVQTVISSLFLPDWPLGPCQEITCLFGSSIVDSTVLLRRNSYPQHRNNWSISWLKYPSSLQPPNPGEKGKFQDWEPIFSERSMGVFYLGCLVSLLQSSIYVQGMKNIRSWKF